MENEEDDKTYSLKKIRQFKRELRELKSEIKQINKMKVLENYTDPPNCNFPWNEYFRKGL